MFHSPNVSAYIKKTIIKRAERNEKASMCVYSFVSSSWSAKCSSGATSSSSSPTGFLIYLSRVDRDFRDMISDVSKWNNKSEQMQGENEELNSKHAIGNWPICTAPRSNCGSALFMFGRSMRFQRHLLLQQHIHTTYRPLFLLLLFYLCYEQTVFLDIPNILSRFYLNRSIFCHTKRTLI